MAQRRLKTSLTMLALLCCMAMAGCGTSKTAKATGVAPTPTVTATATADPFSPSPTPTTGPPCSGGRWGGVTAFGGPNVPLPPLTVTGPAEDTPSGSWTGYFVQLCTGGTITSVTTFVQQHMPPEGWSLGQPPASCVCNGLLVWSRSGDARLIQFEAHPYLDGGAVRWSITTFTQ